MSLNKATLYLVLSYLFQMSFSATFLGISVGDFAVSPKQSAVWYPKHKKAMMGLMEQITWI